MRYEKFTADEDAEILRGLANEKTAWAIARRLKRAESSVSRRIEILERRKKYTERDCLCCGNSFKSEGAHHRLCNRCRQIEKHCFDF